MKKIKINRALISSLIVGSLIVSSVAIQQTIASNNYAVKNIYTIARLTDDNVYSDEVELTSAPEYSENTLKLKKEYKVVFKRKLDRRLKKISSQNLELIIEKIDSIIEDTKQDETMSLEKQEKRLAQLLALREVIEDILSDKTELSIDIDIEEILRI